jgi:hypothetical protein
MSETPIIFIPWCGQHEQLGIPKYGLPVLSKDEVSNFLDSLERYEAAMGIVDPSDVGISKKTLARDLQLLALIIADERGIGPDQADVPLNRSRLRIEEISNHGDDKTANWDGVISWERDTALKFICRLTKCASLKVAAFLYIYQCDELAAGVVEEEDTLEFVWDTYVWVWSHSDQAQL